MGSKSLTLQLEEPVTPTSLELKELDEDHLRGYRPYFQFHRDALAR